MAKKLGSSAYVEKSRRDYSLYIMQSRAIPSVIDGLKASGRRVLWTARDGKKYKSATLAGATMPIHPHASPEGAINTLTAPYGNNIPLFKKDGAFGTLINPTAYGASRYTSVTVSAFTQDVMFRDIEIIPMVENYDGTLMEPQHFLPLVPIVLLNPSEGRAIGYATNILPRSLEDIIVAQISHLRGAKKISPITPKFIPTSAVAYDAQPTPTGVAYYFKGSLQIKDTSTAKITSLPYGQTHSAVIAKLNDLYEKDVLVEYTDNSSNTFDIDLKFRRGYLKGVDEDELYKSLGLINRQIENLNVIDFTGQAVWSATPETIIQRFTDWRLEWYVKRFERLRDEVTAELQRYYDIRTAIRNKMSATALTTKARSEFKQALAAVGVVDTDYISDLPVYRFTEEEYAKNEKRIQQAEKTLSQHLEMLSSEEKRRKLYITELQQVLNKYVAGEY